MTSQTALLAALVAMLVKGDLPNDPSIDPDRTGSRAVEAFTYCTTNDLNTDFCILIDMSVHSGLKRFLVWDLQGDSLIQSFVVSHGSCDGPWAVDGSREEPVFSNVPNSHCSSLGKYRIGTRGHSQWGIGVKYVLHGLESTNNNAEKRFVVLHSWELVPDEETYPRGAPESWGCPAISDEALRWLDPKLKSAQKPVLMWIYD